MKFDQPRRLPRVSAVDHCLSRRRDVRPVRSSKAKPRTGNDTDGRDCLNRCATTWPRRVGRWRNKECDGGEQEHGDRVTPSRSMGKWRLNLCPILDLICLFGAPLRPLRAFARGAALPVAAVVQAVPSGTCQSSAFDGDPFMTCGRGGTGRRAALRSLWPKGRGSSSLLDRTIRSGPQGGPAQPERVIASAPRQTKSNLLLWAGRWRPC